MPIGPVNSPKTIADDPQFHDRFPWLPRRAARRRQLPTPIKFVGEELPAPADAPTVGEHTDEVLHDVLGWDDARIAESRARGGLGGKGPGDHRTGPPSRRPTTRPPIP